MALDRLLVLAICVGSTLACLTDTSCKDMDDEATAARSANNIPEYCRLKSKSIACWSGDTYSCPNETAAMQPMKTDYYNTCSVSAESVENCKRGAYTCDISAALEHLSNQDISNYCSSMTPYLTCVNNSMTSCDSGITIYDVLGSVKTTYERFCKPSSTADKKAVCQGVIYSAGCVNNITDATDALTNMNINLYCSIMDSYMECFNEAFKRCDPSLNKDSIVGGINQGYQQYCSGGSGSSVQVCQAKAYSCYPKMGSAMNVSNPLEMCSGLKDYFACVKGVMKDCDPSVKQSDIVGQIEKSYNFMCGVSATGSYCPAVAKCIQPMMAPSKEGQQPSGGQGSQPNMSPENPNIMQDCSKLWTLMSCLHTELSACSFTSPRNYMFNDMATLYVTGCQALFSDNALLTCQEMTTCMNTLKFPTDPTEISRLYYDPQFWCSMLKSTVACAENKANQCKSDQSKYTKLLSEVNQVCPEAKVLTTLSGSGVLRVGFLTVFCAVAMVLLSIQL